MDPQREIASRLMDWRRGVPRGPYTLELYPTLRCNLDCAFCDTTYRKKKASDELSRERYLELADEAAELEVRRAYILGGGEPMVARNITPDLMTRLKSHGIYGILGTNATLFTQATLERIVDIEWDEMHVSIDGKDAETHDFLRGQKGVFRRATEAMKRLQALKKETGKDTPRLLFHTVITNKNHTQIPEIVDLAASLGCFRVNFDAIVAYRPEQEILNLNAVHRQALAKSAEAGLKRAERHGLATTLEQFVDRGPAPDGALSQGQSALDRGNMKFDLSGPTGDVLGSPCLNPWHHIVVHHNGRVSPCCVIPAEDSADSAGEMSLKELWFKGPYFTGLRAKFEDKLLTRHCPNCSMAIIGQNDVIRGHMSSKLAGAA